MVISNGETPSSKGVSGVPIKLDAASAVDDECNKPENERDEDCWKVKAESELIAHDIIAD